MKKLLREKKTLKKPMICAYAFDAAGFTIPSAEIDNETYVLRFLPYKSSSTLDEADALIIPSGIFEKMDEQRDTFGEPYPTLRYDPELLALREKQFLNAFKRGAWITFLLGRVDDGGGRWANTDLANKILNVFATGVRPVERNAYIDCKADEFRNYLDRFGIAQTEFWIKDEKSDIRVIANSDERPVAIEVNGQFFFLPFFPSGNTTQEAIAVATLLINAVLEYKRKHDIHLPAWVREIQFEEEHKLAAAVEDLEERIVALKEQQAKWMRYKAILCTSGGNLNQIVVEVLREFFNLSLGSEERFVEDAISPAMMAVQRSL